LARHLVARGDAIVARLSLNGDPIAITYGHRVGTVCHCYQRGVDRTSRLVRSPGTALLLLLMKHLSEQGITRYDHLANANSFKKRYSQEVHALERVQVLRRGLRVTGYVATELALRAARRGWHVLLSRLMARASSPF